MSSKWIKLLLSEIFAVFATILSFVNCFASLNASLPVMIILWVIASTCLVLGLLFLFLSLKDGGDNDAE